MLSDYFFLLRSSLCAQGPQLHVPLFNNLVMSLGRDGWQRGPAKTVRSDDFIYKMTFVDLDP